ncbi:hypothetical protein TRAPUB_5888 [Trametes pubescens]|uniref:Uncharacterized protein n=1 Tax=Trametes pubescens TaxID=154538 RepID=A0A1M2V783_TRAPU|nr:hypothetical protein TRAPUB_5888 [Trametes pubescens]
MASTCPGYMQYAVIRIDPVAMVKHFNDPCAEADAAKLLTKKYLVYLDSAYDLPVPGSEWFFFAVNPISTTLPPNDPARGINPD